jgi:hypothetical protein
MDSCWLEIGNWGVLFLGCLREVFQWFVVGAFVDRVFCGILRIG